MYQLPRLIDSNEAKLVETIDNVSDAQTSVLTLNLVLDVLLGSSLKFMWSMVNTL